MLDKPIDEIVMEGGKVGLTKQGVRRTIFRGEGGGGQIRPVPLINVDYIICRMIIDSLPYLWDHLHDDQNLQESHQLLIDHKPHNQSDDHQQYDDHYHH